MKYAQRDAANEILRTEVLNRLSAQHNKAGMLFVVTFPAALSERVAPLKDMAENTLHLRTGSEYDLTELTKRLVAIGLRARIMCMSLESLLCVAQYSTCIHTPRNIPSVLTFWRRGGQHTHL